MATTVEPSTAATPTKSRTPAPPAPVVDPKLATARVRLAAIVAGVLIVAAGGFWLYRLAEARKQAFASKALMQAEAAADAGNLPLASGEYQKVIDNYKGTSAAYSAVMGLNVARMENGQAALAISSLQEFLKSSPPAEYASQARGILGAALENTGKPAEAAAEYQAAAAGAEGNFLKAELLVNAGRALVAAGKTNEALAVYREVIAKYPKTTGYIEAQVRLAELTKGMM